VHLCRRRIWYRRRDAAKRRRATTRVATNADYRLVGNYFPKFWADLVAALATLNAHDFTHVEFFWFFVTKHCLSICTFWDPLPLQQKQTMNFIFIKCAAQNIQFEKIFSKTFFLNFVDTRSLTLKWECKEKKQTSHRCVCFLREKKSSEQFERNKSSDTCQREKTLQLCWEKIFLHKSYDVYRNQVSS
jgi:hypothetical protein